MQVCKAELNCCKLVRIHVLLYELQLLHRYRLVTPVILSEINAFYVHEKQILNVNRTEVVMDRHERR